MELAKALGWAIETIGRAEHYSDQDEEAAAMLAQLREELPKVEGVLREGIAYFKDDSAYCERGFEDRFEAAMKSLLARLESDPPSKP